MKWTIPLLLLIPVVLFSQNKFRHPSKYANVNWYGQQPPDTIPIIYLYSDTSNYEVDIKNMMAVTPPEKWPDIPPTVRKREVLWEFGYLIKIVSNVEVGMMGTISMKYTYLDINKKPLRKKLVVWYHKEI